MQRRRVSSVEKLTVHYVEHWIIFSCTSFSLLLQELQDIGTWRNSKILFLLWLIVCNKVIFMIIENCLMIPFPVPISISYPHFKPNLSVLKNTVSPVTQGICQCLLLTRQASSYLGNKPEQQKRRREKNLCVCIGLVCSILNSSLNNHRIANCCMHMRGFVCQCWHTIGIMFT